MNDDEEISFGGYIDILLLRFKRVLIKLENVGTLLSKLKYLDEEFEAMLSK